MIKKFILTGLLVTTILAIPGIYISLKINSRLTTTKDINVLFPGGKSKALILSFDDGNITDSTVIQILNKHKLKGTFFLNPQFWYDSTNISMPIPKHLISQKEVKSIYTGHEVGSHGNTHERLDYLNDSAQWVELKNSKDRITHVNHSVVKSFSYPYGYYNSKTVLLAKTAGYKNARTITNTYNFDFPVDLLQWHPTCSLKEAPELKKHFLNTQSTFWQKWLSIIYQKLKIPYNPSKIMYVWGHSTDMHENETFTWSDFELLCKEFSNHNDVWSATAGDVGSYLVSIKQIITTKNELHNPKYNEQSVWFKLKNKTFILKPGETFNIHDHCE
ncbi:MAG: polysaccharide deacetylase family protein [Bacteroidales bacterium]|nr:polysaccharide deacetylase family protein [Bacteroidales bacterium]